MLRTGLLIDPRYAQHRTPDGHPERPERIATLVEALGKYEREDLVPIAPRPARDDEILSNHSRSLLDTVRATAGRSATALDPDTYTSEETYETALLATGGVLEVVDAVAEGKVDNGFALVRPPGHHAEVDRAMGFCFFNNVAVAARRLIDHHGLDRVMIIDWDVHHGNGTQESFYALDDVLFLSLHRYPFYPGTGAADETGAASGFTVNIPLPAGLGDAEYAMAFRHLVEPIGKQFDPDFVLVSAGFDCHALDPLGGMGVTTGGFRMMARSVLRLAREQANGRLVAVLEGGYSLKALRECALAVTDEMGRVEQVGTGEAGEAGRPPADAVIERVREIQKPFWAL